MVKSLGYLIDHTTIAVDIFAILALVVLIAVIVYFIVMHQRRKKITEELENEISEYYDGTEKPQVTE